MTLRASRLSGDWLLDTGAHRAHEAAFTDLRGRQFSVQHKLLNLEMFNE